MNQPPTDKSMSAEEWTTAEHALRYLARADAYPHRAEGEGVLLEQVPTDARRILDLGTGDGRLLALLKIDRSKMFGVGLDFSEPMLEAARKRFTGDRRIELVRHDFAEPLPALGRFDAVVSSFAIHHLEHERKRALYGEVSDLLEAGGVFANGSRLRGWKACSPRKPPGDVSFRLRSVASSST
jgi:tRNA (cmo5U34)-methyltransferase